MKGTFLLAALIAPGLVACGGQSTPHSAVASGNTAAAADLPVGGAFVGRAWVSTTKGRPLGSMIIFLADRTLLMDSCFETYRISEWGIAGNNIRWREDSIPIEAEVSLPGKDELTLHIVGQDQVQTYIAASVPYVCPDMPK